MVPELATLGCGNMSKWTLDFTAPDANMLLSHVSQLMVTVEVAVSLVAAIKRSMETVSL